MMTKFDFFTQKSDSSTSSGSDQAKKLSKKQAKKLAKENRKSQLTSSDDNQTLAEKISEITLQANQDENLKNHVEEKDDKLPDMPRVQPNPSMYRRHLSESQVDFNSSSNGEFKLKGILKNSTKHRSLSESLNESFQVDEFVFECSPTTDDLTSSNENNSLINSVDSGGSNSLSTTSSLTGNSKRVRFNNQVSRKTFKPGGPVSGMKKLSSNQQRKLKKRKRQDSLNSQSSDQDDGTNDKQSEEYKNPVEFQDILARQAAGGSQTDTQDSTTTKSAVRFTNPLIFELDN